MKTNASIIPALALLAVLSPSFGAERNATLVVDFKVKGQEQWRNARGTDMATVRYTQHVTFSTVVRTDGEVVDFNSRDPDYAARQGSGSYLNFFGFEDCGAKIHIELESVTEGHYADVQGAVPFSVTATASHDAGRSELAALCTQSNFVVDTARKRFQGDGWLVSAPMGTTTRIDRGRTTSSRGEIPFREELIAWASAQLRDAPLSGTRKAVVKMAGTNGTGVPFAVSQGEGNAEVEMAWRFE
jgi:hypothetical protein